MNEDVARIVSYELRDKLARYVRVTSAVLSGDLGHLKVMYVMDDLVENPAAQAMLDKAAGYVGRVLRDTYSLRKSPTVVFYFDAGYTQMARVRELLDAAPATAEPDAVDDTNPAD